MREKNDMRLAGTRLTSRVEAQGLIVDG